MFNFVVENNFFNKISISLILIYFTNWYLAPSERPMVWVVLFLVLVMGSVYNTPLYQFLRKKAAAGLGTAALEPDKLQVLTAIKQLSLYESRTKAWNQLRRNNAKLLSWKQQHQLEKIGYFARISKIDNGIRLNLKLIQLIVEHTKTQHQISYMDLKLPVEVPKDNFRVIESLCHYQRDWTPFGDVECRPILQYIQHQCSLLSWDKARTLVVVPGSGLGRVLHELATTHSFAKVQSIEYSMLMKCLNEFVYSDLQLYSFYPFLHNYSNQVSAQSQLRSLTLQTLGNKPANLDICYGDFTKFQLDPQLLLSYDNILFVTVFFMDTLENLFNYLDAISKLSAQFKGEKLWINAGPLKYGTRPKVELNLKELVKLVQLNGWDVTDSRDPALLGYLTDLESMWQGQYGVSMFTGVKRK